MFRFTIRDVLWLTVVVALAVTAVVERIRLNAALQLALSRESQVTEYLERVEDLEVMWNGTTMSIIRDDPRR